MKRLIDSKFTQKIKSLFASLWTDDKGNVEIGKNLEVDGKANIADTDFGFYPNDFGIGTATGLIWLAPADTNFLVLGSVSTTSNGDYAIDGFVYTDSGYLIFANGAIMNSETGEFDERAIYLNDIIDKRYRHHLRLSGTGATAVADFYSSQNLVCDSLQDLSTVTHDDAFAVSGGEYIEAKKTGGVWQMVKADGTAVNATSVTDAVTVMD